MFPSSLTKALLLPFDEQVNARKIQERTAGGENNRTNVILASSVPFSLISSTKPYAIWKWRKTKTKRRRKKQINNLFITSKRAANRKNYISRVYSIFVCRFGLLKCDWVHPATGYSILNMDSLSITKWIFWCMIHTHIVHDAHRYMCTTVHSTTWNIYGRMSGKFLRQTNDDCDDDIQR